MIMAARKPTMRTHNINLELKAKTWRAFDRILANEDIKVRTVAFRRLVDWVVRRGKLPS